MLFGDSFEMLSGAEYVTPSDSYHECIYFNPKQPSIDITVWIIEMQQWSYVVHSTVAFGTINKDLKNKTISHGRPRATVKKKVL